jgi:hypothetical protein
MFPDGWVYTPYEITLFGTPSKDYNRTSLFIVTNGAQSNNSYYRRTSRPQVAQLNHKILQTRTLFSSSIILKAQSTNLDLLGMKTAPMAFFFHIMFNTFKDITDKITVLHAKKVCKFGGLPPAGLE